MLAGGSERTGRQLFRTLMAQAGVAGASHAGGAASHASGALPREERRVGLERGGREGTSAHCPCIV